MRVYFQDIFSGAFRSLVHTRPAACEAARVSDRTKDERWAGRRCGLQLTVEGGWRQCWGSRA